MKEMNGNEMKRQLFHKIMNWITEERNTLIMISDAPCSNDLDKLSALSKASELGNVQAAITDIFMEDINV
jgi:hypothetical protein